LGLNDPDLSHVPNVGPLPAGRYFIGHFEDRPIVGKFAAPLTPSPKNEMFGRSGFFIHGDNPEMNFTASDGCMVFAHTIRMEIAASGDDLLEVV
jgi:hypothetical protein